MLFKNLLFFKIWRVVKILIQNLTRCKIFWFKIWRVGKFLFQNLTSFKTFSPRSDFLLFFRFGLNDDIFFQRQYQHILKTMRVIVSRQMDNWKLPHVNSSLNVWGKPFWQHTFFTEVTDRFLWSIRCSKSSVFLEIHLCENKRKRSSVRILSIFSNFFVWATRRRVMEKNWYPHSIYPILNAGRYLPKSWNLSKLKMLNRKSNFKTFDAQNIP